MSGRRAAAFIGAAAAGTLALALGATAALEDTAQENRPAVENAAERLGLRPPPRDDLSRATDGMADEQGSDPAPLGWLRGGLPLIADHPDPPYDSSVWRRDVWDRGSRDDGCDTREELLIDASLEPVLTGDGCRVLAGRWDDAYAEPAIPLATRVQIDHRVALSDANDSLPPGVTWDRQEIARFANDKDNLAITDRSINAGKGDRGPDEWAPPDPREWCDYAARYLTTKVRYGLTVTPRQVEGLVFRLRAGRCEGWAPTELERSLPYSDSAVVQYERMADGIPGEVAAR